MKVYYIEEYKIPMKHQIYEYYEYKAVTIVNEDKLVKADLEKEIVVRNGDKTFEMSKKEFERCKSTDNFVLCEGMGHHFSRNIRLCFYSNEEYDAEGQVEKLQV